MTFWIQPSPLDDAGRRALAKELMAVYRHRHFAHPADLLRTLQEELPAHGEGLRASQYNGTICVADARGVLLRMTTNG